MKDGRTPLWTACSKGHVDAARLLLEKGAEVDKAEEDGWTPLLLKACWKGHVDAARLLLDKGAEVDRADKDGETPLFNACWNGHVDAARLLLDKGAEVDRAAEDGATPLWIACWKGHVDAARLLLDNGAAVDRAAEDGGRRCSSPARTATSAWRGCCWRTARRSTKRRRTADAAVHRLPERPRRRGPAAAGQRRGGRSGGQGRLDAAVHRLL